MKYRTALSADTTEPCWGPVYVSADEFEAIQRTTFDEPQEPTESIKEAAKMLRRLYPKHAWSSGRKVAP